MEKVNERYIFGKENDDVYVIADGKRYLLTCHPYEPCLYITDENGQKTTVHNAFDPTVVLECFRKEQTVTSISGIEYDAKDFCEMVEYAAGMGNIGIEIAEEVFRNRPKKKEKANKTVWESDCADDVFYSLIKGYPDCVIDYCIVENEHLSNDYNSHWLALAIASGKLFADDDGEAVWNCNIGKARGEKIDVCDLFSSIEKGRLNYRKAFFYPPYECSYSEKDFDLINAALFPNGTKGLEVYDWTTDWSDYFDEGHEWWGTLCYTVYDNTLDRFCVILASATD